MTERSSNEKMTTKVEDLEVDVQDLAFKLKVPRSETEPRIDVDQADVDPLADVDRVVGSKLCWLTRLSVAWRLG